VVCQFIIKVLLLLLLLAKVRVSSQHAIFFVSTCWCIDAVVSCIIW